MPAALVLMTVEMGCEADVLKALRKVEGVYESFAVYGVYDVVARIKADTMENLNQILTLHIRKIEYVRSTLTMLIIEEPSLEMKRTRT